MQVKYASELQVLQIKNKIVLCQLRVVPRAVEYFLGQNEPHTTHNWMTPEYWKQFYFKVENMLSENIENLSDVWKKKSELFQLNPLIMVNVSRSRVSTRDLCRCINEKALHANDIDVALECAIEYKAEGNWNKSELRGQKDDEHEYQPQCVTGEAVAAGYVPYTPSKKATEHKVPAEISIESENALKVDGEEESYSPKPVWDSSSDMINETPPLIPAYNPATIKKLNCKTNSDDLLANDALKRSKENRKRGKDTKSRKHKSSERKPRDKDDKTTQKETESDKSQACAVKNTLDLPQQRPMDETNDNREWDNDEKTPHKCDGKQVIPVPTECHELMDELLRSLKDNSEGKDSPSLPKVVLERCDSPQSAKKKHNDLFGSDEEENKDIFVTQKQHTSHKKPKYDCSEERRSISTWLTKIQPSLSSSPAAKESQDKTASAVESSNRSAAKEQHKHKRAEKCSSSSTSSKRRPHGKEKLSKEKHKPKKEDPAEMPINLNDMSSTQLIETFSQYKTVLDEVFQKLNTKAYVHGYDGIDHVMVIELIDHTKQLDMMHKLNKEYEANSTCSSIYTTLFANAMMPEWLLGICMKRYGFTRADAIKQITEQNERQIRLSAKTENPFL